jgi:predicted nucleic acid-binding protein
VDRIQPKVVSNSSPLIYLAKIGRLNLIKNVYAQIRIPEAVFNETVTQGKILKITDASIIEEAVGNWILKERISSETDSKYAFLDENNRIGLGEKQALKLCKQLNVDIFIVDDKEARRVSRILKIKPIGTCGMLVQAHRKGLISTNEAEQILDDLIKAKFRIDSTVYRSIIKELRKTKTTQKRSK